MTGFEGWMRSAPLGKEREISRHEIVKDDPCLQRLQASTALTLRESQPTVENPIGWSCHLQFGHLYKRSMTLPYQWLFLQFFCRFEVSTAPTWLKMDGQLCNKPGCTNALPLQSAILYYYRQTTEVIQFTIAHVKSLHHLSVLAKASALQMSVFTVICCRKTWVLSARLVDGPVSCVTTGLLFFQVLSGLESGFRSHVQPSATDEICKPQQRLGLSSAIDFHPWFIMIHWGGSGAADETLCNSYYNPTDVSSSTSWVKGARVVWKRLILAQRYWPAFFLCVHEYLKTFLHSCYATMLLLGWKTSNSCNKLCCCFKF